MVLSFSKFYQRNQHLSRTLMPGAAGLFVETCAAEVTAQTDAIFWVPKMLTPRAFGWMLARDYEGTI
jgi:hypothetical protein